VPGARLTLSDNPVGQLRRRVQAYLQIHQAEAHTAEAIAASLDVPPEATLAALEELVASGAATRRTEGPLPAYAINTRQRRLGDLLIESELITPAQLEEAVAEQAKTGLRLGQILTSRGFITKQALGEALQAQRGTPYVNLATAPIDEALLRSVPPAVIAEHRVVPFARVGREVHVAMVDPTDVVAIDHLAALLRARVRPFFTTEQDFAWVLAAHFDMAETAGATVEAVGAVDVVADEFAAVSASDSPHDPPVVRLVDSLIQGAIREGATDIHIEPQSDGTVVRYRLDGLLHERTRVPRGVGAAVTSRLKALAGLDIAERVRPQDGRLLYEAAGREHDLRIASVGATFGERVTIRVLDKSRVLLGLERLGLLPEQQALLDRLLGRPYGMLLVTGPTGCGKTTTLYSCVSRINDASRNIMTVEDPVEYHLPGITQIAVRSKMAVSFATGLRSIIRHDPDVVMVGEIRDAETAQIAVQAALTGHLVLSTLHTNDAAGAVVRLIDMGVDPFLITSTLLAAIGQRLVRTLCPACKRPVRASPEHLREMGRDPSADIILHAPHGCAECNRIGYRGRTGVFEIMRITDGIREMVVQRRPAGAIRDQATREGMRSMRDSAVTKVVEGATSLDEVRRVVFAGLD
jgi:type IV pilus assembly protein PilB